MLSELWAEAIDEAIRSERRRRIFWAVLAIIAVVSLVVIAVKL